ncbi:MAG: OsmC family peroxiredoxin [Bacteroidetes bacterium]|nr:MAG: OsmC family peroxiredoxin [Bacteroidota bacterium]
MNPTATIDYLGGLRTQATHLRSNSHIITDAPVDNNGKGEAFSPTDLLATALVSCMITVMGIHASKNDIPMGEVHGKVEKIMGSGPRRVSILNVELVFENHHLSEAEKKRLEAVAINCPVAKSISADIAMNVKFNYM